MVARKKQPAATAPATTVATAEPATASEPAPAGQLEAPVVNTKKRSASRSISPPRTQPGSEADGTVSQGESQETENSTESSKKRARTSAPKKEKEFNAPTRTSTRKLTKANSKASMLKAGIDPPSRSKSKNAKQSASTREPRVHAPPLNPLPGIPEKVRPGRQLFVFGTGDMGQFGLGTDVLGEIKRPRLHAWFDSALKEGKLGSEPGAGLEKVAAGGMHNLVADEAGRVWSWGINDGAALGRQTAGLTDPQTNEPIESEVLETQPMVVQKLVADNFHTVFVAAGDSVSIALSDQGELRAWGSFRSSEGVLGFDGKPGSAKFQFDPISLPAIKKEKFVEAACGADHVIALTIQGHVFAWGDARQGAIGRRVLERHIMNGLDPDRLALRNIVHVASGAWHSFAVDKDGVVYGWGLNSMGQAGITDTSYFDLSNESERELEDHIPSPTVVEALHPDKLGNGRKVVQISGGEHHSVFLLNDGSVYACGRHDSAQLGLSDDHPTSQALKSLKEKLPSTLECVPYPVQVFFPPAPTPDNNDPPLQSYAQASALSADGGPLTPIQHINAGTRHNLAVSRAGIVYGWGYGSQYQLGMGEVDQQDVPARVKSAAIAPFNLESAYAGGQHCLLVARRKEEEAMKP